MNLDLASYENRHSLKSKIARVIWGVVWLVLYRPTPSRVRLFSRWRIFLLRLFGARIGRSCIVMSSVIIWQPWNLEMGDFVALSEHVNCYSVDKIALGDNVTISREAFLCCASHDISSPIMALTHRPIVIGANAWIAARAFIGPGVTVGSGAVVGAVAVVTRDVAPWTVVAGNPAKVIGNRVLKARENASSETRH